MTEFTASNGIKVDIGDDERVHFTGARVTSPVWLGDGEIQALREFFQHERDEELGRWRWPENPEYVVYGHPSGDATVFREQMPVGGILYRRGDDVVDMESQAARAYFETRPERKPWHDAKPGETWRLTVEGMSRLGMDLTFNVIGVTDHVQARFARPQVSGEQMEYSIDSDAIVAGRRIWPEGDAS